MLADLGSNPKIGEFLHLYPKSEWKDCITHILIIGISALENSFKRFLPLEELMFISESTPLPLNFQIPDFFFKAINLIFDFPFKRFLSSRRNFSWDFSRIRLFNQSFTTTFLDDGIIFWFHVFKID